MLDSGQAHYKTVVPCIGLGSNFFGVLPLHNFKLYFIIMPTIFLNTCIRSRLS
jgi:hypothetical protein